MRDPLYKIKWVLPEKQQPKLFWMLDWLGCSWTGTKNGGRAWGSILITTYIKVRNAQGISEAQHSMCPWRSFIWGLPQRVRPDLNMAYDSPKGWQHRLNKKRKRRKAATGWHFLFCAFWMAPQTIPIHHHGFIPWGTPFLELWAETNVSSPALLGVLSQWLGKQYPQEEKDEQMLSASVPTQLPIAIIQAFSSTFVSQRLCWRQSLSWAFHSMITTPGFVFLLLETLWRWQIV